MEEPLQNFAAASPSWATYVAGCSARKRPVPPRTFRILERYIGDPEASLDGTTFRYLAEYLATGAQPPRLEVACFDFGYSLGELHALRAKRKTGRDVAAEIVGRGVRSSSV